MKDRPRWHQLVDLRGGGPADRSLAGRSRIPTSAGRSRIPTSAGRSRIRRLLGVLLALVTLLGAGLLLAPSASAHAGIVATDPVDGSRLKAMPSTVTISFDQTVELGSIGYLHVVNQGGRRVDTGAATHPGGDASKIVATLPSGLGDGTYTASFRVISADSHPVAGAIRFIVGTGSSSAASLVSSSTVNPVTGLIFDVIRWFAFAGLTLLGGGWLLLSVWPAGRDDRRARGLVWVGWWASVVGAGAELLIQGPYDAGTAGASVLRWSLLDATLHTDFGLTHSLRLIALGGLGAVLGPMLGDLGRARSNRARPGLAELAGLLLTAIAVTFAVSGHSFTEHPQWLALTSDTLHLLAMSVWLGGLTILLMAVLPRREPGELAGVLAVFSKVAYISVATLAVTGSYQAWLGVGSWRALADTSYGRLVLLKILLFAALLGLGNLSRVVVQRRWVPVPVPVPVPMPVAMAYAVPVPVAGGVIHTAGSAGAVPDPEPDSGPGDDDRDGDERAGLGRVDVTALRRSVLVEVALAAMVLAVSAVLVAEPPGAAALITLDSRAHTVTAALSDGQSAAITVNTQRAGPVGFTIVLSGGTKPQSITVTAALAAKQLGPISIPFTAQAQGYSASPVLLPDAGSWLITLDVRSSQFDSTVATATVVLH